MKQICFAAANFCTWVNYIAGYLAAKSEILAEFPHYKASLSPSKAPNWNSVMEAVLSESDEDSESSDEDFRVGTIKDKFK